MTEKERVEEAVEAEERKRERLYTLNGERASRLLQETRARLTPAIREALKVAGFQSSRLWGGSHRSDKRKHAKTPNTI